MITLLPIVYVVLSNGNNLESIIIPPQLSNLIRGGADNGFTNDNASSPLLPQDFEMPQPKGTPTFNAQTNTVALTFNFTNPLQTPITVDQINSGIVSHDDNTFLGNLTIDQPIILSPGQTADITAVGHLTDQGINYLQSQNHQKINVDLTNINLEVGGLTVHIDRQNIGNIEVPQQLFG
ncbi:MAG: hypothetical protein ACM3UL_03590 [Ignavibacteria bacterium]